MEKISARVFDERGNTQCILFLHGGSIDNGKDRFFDWQKDFAKNGISSVAFDFVGVGDSIGNISHESLEKRIEDAIKITEWMKNKFPKKKFTICGVSMGAYVALGVVDRVPMMFDKLIIQAPAAYSQSAHFLPFDQTFTKELRKPQSWKKSPAFRWWKNYKKSKLLVSCEKDLIIPCEIIETYRNIGEMSKKFIHIDIEGAPHNIWKATKNKKKILNEVYQEILSFVLK